MGADGMLEFADDAEQLHRGEALPLSANAHVEVQDLVEDDPNKDRSDTNNFCTSLPAPELSDGPVDAFFANCEAQRPTSPLKVEAYGLQLFHISAMDLDPPTDKEASRSPRSDGTPRVQSDMASPSLAPKGSSMG